jgi:uncharacterized protein (TIGR03435 family)
MQSSILPSTRRTIHGRTGYDSCVIRRGLLFVVGALAVLIAVVAATLNMHRHASPEWSEFAIGPAAGQSVSVNPGAIHADGMTLRTAVAIAYDIPTVRVIGPPWLDQARYSLHATIDSGKSATFRALLQEELNERLHLDAHVEQRPFEVFVLTATEGLRVERARGNNPRTWLRQTSAELRETSMGDLAAAVQVVVGTPVIDETGVKGAYNLNFEWGADRAASVTAVLHDRYGLRLSPERRTLEALVVDSVRRDAALVLLGYVGRMTQAAPRRVRQHIANALAIQ